jgi:hypothetical protein
MPNTQILKDLNAVLTYAKQRFHNEFVAQEIVLNDSFKLAYKRYLATKDCSIEYLTHTTIITTKAGKKIYVANQWFAIASYMVDFCTELLTYKYFLIKICDLMHVNVEVYIKKMKETLNPSESQHFLAAAKKFLKKDFSQNPDIDKVSQYLLNFVNNYSWWSGNKTIDRADFFVSPVLNALNIVNVSHGYVADIIFAFSTDIYLRKLVENLDSFAINPQINKYTPDEEETKLYRLAEGHSEISIVLDSNAEHRPSPTISISAASLNRFRSKG